MACDNIYHRCSTFNPDVQRSRGDYLAKASKGEQVDDETEVVIDKLSFICAFITDYAGIIKSLSARRAEKEAMQGTQTQRKDGALGARLRVCAAAEGRRGRGREHCGRRRQRRPEQIASAQVGRAYFGRAGGCAGIDRAQGGLGAAKPGDGQRAQVSEHLFK